jgi:hypothetical protein
MVVFHLNKKYMILDQDRKKENETLEDSGFT